MPVLKVDLHIHSEHSDGENSLREIFNIIQKQKIAMFSITDHNYISPHIKKIEKQASKKGITLIQGIEISSHDSDNQISMHILGYSRNFDIDKINKSLKDVIRGYNTRAKKIIKKLNNKYQSLKLNFNSLIEKGKSPFVSRNILANELVKFYKKNQNRQYSMKQALEEAYTKEKDNSWLMSPKKAVEIIVACGGTPVLAHPGKMIKFIKKNKKFIQILKESGLAGLEMLYPSHNEKEKKNLFLLAKKYNLFVTAGSDWHGKMYPPFSGIGIRVNKDFFLQLKKNL